MEILYSMALFYVAGLVSLVYTLFKDRSLLRFDCNLLWKATLAILVLIPLKIMAFNHFFPDLVANLAFMTYVPLWVFFMVFWEDLVFTMPILHMKKRGVRKRFLYPVMALSFGVFTVSHLYQGLMGLSSIIYIYWFSYKGGQEFGLGTVMVLHVLFDVVTILSMGAVLW